MSKLRNGHRVRIRAGDGCGLVVHPSRFNQVSRTLQTKGMEIQLTPEELQMNRQFQGQGIFSFLKKHKHALAKTAVNLGATALVASNPALAPFVPALVAGAHHMIGEPKHRPVGQGLSEHSSVGLNGGFVQRLPPALQSQADASNFVARPFMNPTVRVGSGLYA